MASYNRVQIIYNSRLHLIDIMQSNGYDVSPYAGFSVSEIDERIKAWQMDMILQHSTEKTKAYVKYMCGYRSPIKNLSGKTLDTIIDELFVLSDTLAKNDTLILVVDDDLNDSMREKLKYMYDHDGYFVVAHNISRLQFNLLKHALVPPSSVAKKEEVDALLEQYRLPSVDLLPEIGRFDPVALALCLRPGQVCKILRPSPTAGTTPYYRVCV
jgi:DNA-directed RNA polymerase subunit H (RpoH/RPB5)